MPALELSLHPPSQQAHSKDVKIWDETVAAVETDPEVASAWFSVYLQQPGLMLVQAHPLSVRLASNEITQDSQKWPVSFPDSQPFLVVTEASVQDLNTRLVTNPVPYSRFRPNFVVRDSSGNLPPYDEDRWQSLRIGGIEFLGVEWNTRCKVTTIDQWSGVANPQGEPFKFRFFFPPTLLLTDFPSLFVV